MPEPDPVPVPEPVPESSRTSARGSQDGRESGTGTGTGWVRKRAKWVALVVAILTLLPPAAIVVASYFVELPQELLEGPPSTSIWILDRDGHLLREARADDGTRARWVPLDELGPTAISAMIAAEDRRFRSHHGVDAIAVLRAIGSGVWHRRIVSGASTITMQLARTLRPRPRTLAGKVREMVLALRIERSVSKDRILEEYANRVPFGPNLRGIGAASEAFLAKRPKDLSIAEAALLAGIVRGPSVYAPDKHPTAAKARRAVVLARMEATGAITAEQRAIADGEPIAAVRAHPAFGAPHFVQGLISGALHGQQPGLADTAKGGVAAFETTIDASLQREAEATVRVTLERLRERNVTAASVIVIEHATGDVLAWVGSPDVFDQARLGANDGVLAKRQPGSALKPFLYALAIETKGFLPSTVLPDVPLTIATPGGAWTPLNYDGKHHGPVRLREALASSLNVPAAWTIREVGVAPFLDRLHALGFASLTEAAEHYGPALSLGAGEVRLVELANAYATLARAGLHRPLRLARAVVPRAGGRVELEPAPETRVMPAVAGALVTDVLKDRKARMLSFGDVTALDFPFDVAAKTGTSKGFRDNWALGSSSAVTVGVWVGNFDGSPMHEVSGISGAGPIFQAVMEAAMRKRAPAPIAIAATGSAAMIGDERLVSVEVCALSGARASTSCPHRHRDWAPEAAVDTMPTCDWHVPLRIDRRNGLRAGPACAAHETETRVYERLPPEYLAWATAAKRPLVPESSPFCPAADDGSGVAFASTGLAIRAPLDGTKLVIDPERPRDAQVLDVEVVAPPSVTEVVLRVDGVRFATAKRPFVFAWPIVEGKHALVVQAGTLESPPVRVEVRH